MKKGYILVSAVIILSIIIGASIFFMLKTRARKEIVSLSIMVENATVFNSLSTWLDDLSYSKFTFVLWEEAENDILNNATRISKLEQYGDIIPRRDYTQMSTPQQRKDAIDSMIAEYNSSLGYVPKGIMSFIPDTYTAQYLLSRNFSYIQGYCIDQFIIDYMTQRGGWQLPYYAHSSHALRPNTSPRGLVILPHVTWDWLESFRIHHRLNTHPISVLQFFDNVSQGKQYWLELIDYSLSGCDPFGYVGIQTEWAWIKSLGWDDEFSDWINTLVQNRTYDMWTFKETAEWLLQNYQFTPTYTVNFTSPYSEESIEWYYYLEGRVARIGNEVVSYVDYTNQVADKFIVERKGINWGIPPSDLNCIDNSLTFEIDALGGGELRLPVKTASVTYSGDLSHFRSWYGGSH